MKYSYEKKLHSVLEVVSHHRGLKVVAKELGTHHEHLRRWVKLYEEFGDAGLQIKRVTYSSNFKLSVLTYMRENHLSLKEVAVKFGIPNDSTVYNWDRIYRTEGLEGLKPKKRGRKKKMDPKKLIANKQNASIEKELLAENERLRAENAYLKKLRVLVEERIVRERGSESKPSKD